MMIHAHKTELNQSQLSVHWLLHFVFLKQKLPAMKTNILRVWQQKLNRSTTSEKKQLPVGPRATHWTPKKKTKTTTRGADWHSLTDAVYMERICLQVLKTWTKPHQTDVRGQVDSSEPEKDSTVGHMIPKFTQSVEVLLGKTEPWAHSLTSLAWWSSSARCRQTVLCETLHSEPRNTYEVVWDSNGGQQMTV